MRITFLRKIKKAVSVLLILILLPYIITIFMNGGDVRTSQDQALDDYCIGILSKEVSSDYEEEMLKAQAVIVRTTIYQNIKELDKENLEKPELDSFWYQKLKRAWDATEGQVILYEDELALVPFHQLSNGQTRNGKEVLGTEDYPYLKVKDCSKDIEAAQQLQMKMLQVSDIEIVAKDSAGYVTEVKISGESCSGDNFRNTYGLSSSSFEIQELEGTTRVTTRGVGHGLGLSQYTANEMAKEGKTYQEILQYFFEGTEIKEVAEILWETE